MTFYQLLWDTTTTNAVLSSITQKHPTVNTVATNNGLFTSYSAKW